MAVLKESDIDFLARGEFGLRYISGRPDLVKAHQSPEGVDGDAYSLSALAHLLPREEAQKYPHSIVAIFNNKAQLTGALEKTIAKIVDRALNESPDGGRSLTFMLLKDMSGASMGYDVHPQYMPTGKAGRRTILPGQIAATIKLDDMDVLEGEINQELGKGPGVKDMLVGRIIEGISRLRPQAPENQAGPKPANPQK